MELDQSLLTHRNDVERAQEMMLQREAQVQSDFRAMMAEFKWKKVKWAEEWRVNMEKSDAALAALQEKQKESEAAICAE